MADFTGFLGSDNIEDRRRRRVPPEISEGTFSGGSPTPNVFDASEGRMTGLNPDTDFHQGPTGPLSQDAGLNDLPVTDAPVRQAAGGPQGLYTPSGKRATEQQAIIQAAREQGVNPAYALAVAKRESNFNPSAHSSKTIHGIFQMTGGARDKFGVGNSEDPYTQAKGWMGFQKEVRKEMSTVLGREPTDAEAYLGHHFGGVRAARTMTMDPNTPVEAVFTPREIAENPHFAKAGTVGNLNSTILADMDKKIAEHGGESASNGTANLNMTPEADAKIDPKQYPPDFSDGASPVGFENAAAVPPPASATGQQIAANAEEPGVRPPAFKPMDPIKESPSVEHIASVAPAPAMSQVGNVVAPVPAMPTAPPTPPGQPDPLALMLGSQDRRRMGMLGGIPV